MTRPQTRYPGPIPSTLDPRTPTSRNPYARLVDIERRARAGERFADAPRPPTPSLPPIKTPRRADVKIGSTQPRELAVEHKERPGSFGHLVASTLLAAPDPLAVQLPVTDINEKELNTTQQAGRRWLDRTGNGDLKLHYRRRNASDAVFYLTRRNA